jgi:hypothetical protein
MGSFAGSFTQSDLQKEEEGVGFVQSCSGALIGQNFHKPCHINCIFLSPQLCQNPCGADCHPQGGNKLFQSWQLNT